MFTSPFAGANAHKVKEIVSVKSLFQSLEKEFSKAQQVKVRMKQKKKSPYRGHLHTPSRSHGLRYAQCLELVKDAMTKGFGKIELTVIYYNPIDVEMLKALKTIRAHHGRTPDSCGLLHGNLEMIETAIKNAEKKLKAVN